VAAPEAFAAWLNGHQHQDSNGFTYHYHSRSDAHSKELAHLIWVDLLVFCPEIRRDHQAGLVRMSVNYKHTWPGTYKTKTIDMAVGTVGEGGLLKEVIISCELKAVMTEHQKSQPRVFDELSSSHQIVHAADRRALAAGVTVVNIADSFVSPLRQRAGLPIAVTRHKQPRVTESMLAHLRGLPVRPATAADGFDAYCSIVIDCNNIDSVSLSTAPPAPQAGEADHYMTFVERICRAYASRHP